MIKRISLVLCLLPVFASAQVESSTTSLACPDPLPWSDEKEGESYDCGLVTVPENHDAANGRTIDLVYLRLKAKTLSPRPDPLIYLSGGPGGSALHEITTNQLLFENMASIRERRDVIFYDQRGTGHSHFLSCAPFAAAVGVVAELKADEIGSEALEALDRLAGQDKQSATMLAICSASYKSSGADVGQINSVASSRDIELLATGLGYAGDYNLYGTSYGTRLAQNAMRSTPDRIRAVVLDGTVSPGHSGTALTVAKVQAHYDTLFELCAADAFCSEKWPNVRERFIAVLGKLAEDPYVFDPPLVGSPFMRNRMPVIERIDPAFFGSFGVLNNGAAQGGLAGVVPMIIEALENENDDLLRKIFGDAEAQGPMIEPISTDVEIVKPDDVFLAPALDIILSHAAVSGQGAGIEHQFLTLLLDDLEARLFADEAQAEVVKDFVELSIIPFASPDRAALTTFIEEKVTETSRPAASALLGAMEDDDLRRTFWAIGDVASTLDGSGGGRALSFSTLIAVNCPEDVVFTPVSFAQDYANASPYPGVFVQTVEDYEEMHTYCQFFPTPFEKEEMHSFVESDLPTLIFQQGLDTQTPFFMGLEVAEFLSNSTLVEWPSEGHVIAARSPDGCAGDIAAAFLDTPSDPPNTTCSTGSYYQIPFETLYGMITGLSNP